MSPPAATKRVLSPSDDPSSSAFSATLGGNVGSGITLSGTLSGGLSGSFNGDFSASGFTLSGSLDDGSTFSIDNGTYSYDTNGNSFSGTLNFSGTTSNGDTISGSGNFSGTVDNNNNFSGNLSLSVALSNGDLFNVSGSFSGAIDDSGNVSGSLSGSIVAFSPPTANNDTYTLPHDTTLSVPAAGVLANDTDPNGLPLSAVLVSNASHGAVQLNSDGSFTYIPDAHFTGSDSFTYYASGGQLASNTATVTLNVTDTGIITTQPDSYSVLHDQPLSVDASTGLLANDSDSDGDSLTASIASQPSNGNVIVNPDGSFAYTPNAGYVGTDSFQYTASDGVQTSAPTTVSINVTDNAPTAIDHSYGIPENTAENVTAAAGLLSGASDADDDSLTVSSWAQPGNGSLQVNADGSFTYTPNTDYTGTDSFQYTVSDGALTATATVTLNVHAGDTAPAANDDSYSVLHDQELDVDASTGVLANDSDADGDPLTATLVSGPANGTLSFNVDGSFTYTPDAGFYGSDSFTFKAFDGTSYSNVATATLTVAQDKPTASALAYSVLPSDTTSVPANDGVLAFDTDTGPNLLTAVLVSSTSHGSLTLNGDGSFSYTPGPDFAGNDSFTYEAYDGIADSAPTTVTLTTAPVDLPQTYTVVHDTPLVADATLGLELGAYDADGDTLTTQLVSGPSNGTVSVNSDGSFTYIPNSGYLGTDSFQFTVSDGSTTAATATATINVINDVPVAGDSDYGTTENEVLAVDADNGVLTNAADEDGDSLVAQLVSAPSNGTLELSSDGAFIYTPAPGFVGTDTFVYDASDGVSASAPDTVTIYVGESIPENQPNSMPSAVAVADFTNDGYPDVAMADQGRNTVSVYADNNGVVSATPLSTTTVGNAPVALAAGDFGNGQQDLAVVNRGDNTVSILLGNGAGAFTAGTTLTGFNDPVALITGDFNGDGKTDLAVVNGGSNAVSILLGNGNGTFTPGATLIAGGSPTAIAAADFNNDGMLDLVVTNSASNTVSVFLGNGDGTFQPPLTNAVGSAPMSVTTGDFDGDGNVDLAVVAPCAAC